MPGRGRISPSAAGSPRPALGGPWAKEMAVGAPVVSSGLTVGGAVRRVAYSADITGLVERGLGSSFLPTRHLRATEEITRCHGEENGGITDGGICRDRFEATC